MRGAISGDRHVDAARSVTTYTTRIAAARGTRTRSQRCDQRRQHVRDDEREHERQQHLARPTSSASDDARALIARNMMRLHRVQPPRCRRIGSRSCSLVRVVTERIAGTTFAAARCASAYLGRSLVLASASARRRQLATGVFLHALELLLEHVARASRPCPKLALEHLRPARPAGSRRGRAWSA